jgi:hypothetical protein
LIVEQTNGNSAERQTTSRVISSDNPETGPHVASAAAIWPPLRRFIAGEHRLGL